MTLFSQIQPMTSAMLMNQKIEFGLASMYRLSRYFVFDVIVTNGAVHCSLCGMPDRRLYKIFKFIIFLNELIILLPDNAYLPESLVLLNNFPSVSSAV